MAKLRRPLVMDISFKWQEIPSPDIEAYPLPVPDLYAGEPVVVVARIPGDGHNVPQLTIEGKIGQTSWQRRLSLENERSSTVIEALWARAKIDHIENGVFVGDDREIIRMRALAVALEHELVTAYTSLVAVDDVVARPPDASLENREIARNLPHGWRYESVFGDEPAMRMRPLPNDLLREASRGNLVHLPRTATSSRLYAITGFVLFSMGCAFLYLMRRTHGRRKAA